MINQQMLDAFNNELEAMEKEALLGPLQALKLRGGIGGILKSLGRGAKKTRSAIPTRPPPAAKMVDPTTLKSETEAALKANPKLQAVTKQFPVSTQATELRPGYALTPTSTKPVTQMPIPKGATPTMVPENATAVGAAVAPTPRPGVGALQTARGVSTGKMHGPNLPPKYLSARQIRKLPLSTMAVQQAASARKVAMAMLKFAALHYQSSLTNRLWS